MNQNKTDLGIPTDSEKHRNALGSKEALRDLIEKIVLTPSQDGAGLDIDLYGAIAGLLPLATGVSAQNSQKGLTR
ncbi:hypothetical protein [Martelella soudanensis]|uniref:hypothetical protein n=1 Tax=unclassified Martelella TaxID=2629616 RepID=UPI0015DD5D31|nr:MULTISPECIES: hypothetical protein [unclassified Martelella]